MRLPSWRRACGSLDREPALYDPKELGSIYHAMVAWACSNPDVLENERAIADLLSRQASPLAFDAEALRASLKAFFAWIAATWPGSEVCAEYPVSATLDNGQRVVGRIDLLIRTAKGLVVMDHKLASSRGGKAEEIVATWVPFGCRSPDHEETDLALLRELLAG